MSTARWTVVGALLVLSVGCGSGEAPSEPPATGALPVAAEAPAPSAPVASGAKEQAEKIFATRCFTCHGMAGAGDGPGSAALMPKPRNFQDAAWQASVTDDHIAKIIQFGGVAVGKSPAMPGNPDLISKAEIVQALVAHVRTLGAPQ